MQQQSRVFQSQSTRTEINNSPYVPKKLIWILVLAACFVSDGLAQGTSQETFEVASIRPMEPYLDCVSRSPPGSTHFSITCFNLRQLIAISWGVDPDNIQGGDAAALGTYYDIRATTPGEKPWVWETARAMLQHLLIERFHLSVHSDSKKQSGYGLYIAKGGSKLKSVIYDASKNGNTAGVPASNYLTESHIQGRQAKMVMITGLLSRVVREPVVDHTGISGVFNIDIDFAPLNDSESPLPSFFSVVEDQLGLKLRPEQVTVPTLVIDHVDESPTAN